MKTGCFSDSFFAQHPRSTVRLAGLAQHIHSTIMNNTCQGTACTQHNHDERSTLSLDSLRSVSQATPTSLSVMQLIRNVMTKAREAGLNVVRAWATSASSNYALQTSPGNFSEAMFRGLDYALDQARQLDLKVCLLCQPLPGRHKCAYDTKCSTQTLLQRLVTHS